ncbi:putative nuclease HARBI1 [Lucilia cuprina]|nr:putative nuclease HARBI1 [Lucilia cuprina]
MFGSIAISLDSDSSESDNDDTRLCRRNIRDATNVLDLPEERFIASFRVNKEVFVMLLEEITPNLKVAYRNTHIPAPTKLATFLLFLATGGYQTSIGNECFSSISKSQVYLCSKWIKLEDNNDSEVKEFFYNYGGIPGVVGCVDGTHVRIKAPGNERNHLYYNRKGYFSINVMLVSFITYLKHLLFLKYLLYYTIHSVYIFLIIDIDHNMVITYVDARHPGANHDSFIWDQRDFWLLNCLILMTPYRNPTELYEKKYNEKHCKIRK